MIGLLQLALRTDAFFAKKRPCIVRQSDKVWRTKIFNNFICFPDKLPRRKCSDYLRVQCCIKQGVNVHGSEGFKLWHFSTQRVWLTVWHVPRAWMSVTNSFTSLCNYQVFHSVGLFMQLKAFIKQIDFKIQICCYFWPQS